MANTDPSVLIALIGIPSTFILAASGVAVAFINNKKERRDTADSAVEKVLQERITLRDEQIADLRGDVIRLDEMVKRKDATIAELRRKKGSSKL